jgi:hypothetical protein
VVSPRHLQHATPAPVMLILLIPFRSHQLLTLASQAERGIQHLAIDVCTQPSHSHCIVDLLFSSLYSWILAFLRSRSHTFAQRSAQREEERVKAEEGDATLIPPVKRGPVVTMLN